MNDHVSALLFIYNFFIICIIQNGTIMKARRKKTCSKNCIYIHDGKKKKSPKVEMIRRYQYLIGLHFCSLLLLVGNPLLAFHFWSKRDANRTVDTGSVNIWYESFFFFLKKGVCALFFGSRHQKNRKSKGVYFSTIHQWKLGRLSTLLFLSVFTRGVWHLLCNRIFLLLW